MYQKSAGGRWLEILLFTLSSLFLYHTGVGIVLFLIPLQVVASRRGLRGLLISTSVFMAVFLAIRFYPAVVNRGGSLPDILGSMEIGVVALFLLGMIAVNFPLRRRPRTLAMLLAATGAAALAALPIALWLPTQAGFQQSMANLFVEISKTLAGVLSPVDSVGGSLLTPLLEPAKLRQISEAYLLRSLAADYAMLLSFSWWAGQAASARTAALFGVRPTFRFAEFRLEGWWLWPLIAAGALVLADLFFGISFLAYAAWNVGLVLLFLFGLQGMAILRFLFEKHGIPRLLWLLLLIVLAVLAASPRAGLFVLLTVPVFGVSENWIRFRVPHSPVPTEKS
jgi:hypothetical protein